MQQEQEIEIEKYVDLAYSRDEEAPTPWPFRNLVSLAASEQFYPASEFHLYKRPPLAFEDYLLVSNNYFDKRWSGARRIKNVVMVLEWTPKRSQVSLKRPQSDALDEKQDSALRKAFHLFDQDNSGDINEEEFRQLTHSAVDYIPLPPEDELKSIMLQFTGENKEALTYDQVIRFLQSGVLRPEQTGRYFILAIFCVGLFTHTKFVDTT